VWAPHVEASPDGSYYLYISYSLRIGVARADSPLGPFVDVLDHPLVGLGYGHVGNGVLGDTQFDVDENAIDAFVLRDDDGSLTLFFSAYDPLSKIYATPMLDYATLADVEPQLVLAPDQGWEGPIAEGAWIEKHAGRYHLMYSGNVYLTTSYAIGVAVADSRLGPYEKYPDNPIFSTNVDAELFAPGHNSVVAGFGEERLMFYHTKQSGAAGADRQIRYALVEYDADGRLGVQWP
jgi:beta-xylosidase